MTLKVLTSGLFLFSMTAMADGGTAQQPGQVELGNNQTYSIDGMKDRCRLFQSSAQLKPFSIRIECAKTENRWEAMLQKRPLPLWVEYEAAGSGKGLILEEKGKENLAPQEYECVNYQEKTVLYKGYVELSCDDFISQVSSLKTLCSEGLVSKQGVEAQIDWQQVGELETGKQFSNGCDSKVEQITGQTEQKPGQQESGQQKPGQQESAQTGQQHP